MNRRLVVLVAAAIVVIVVAAVGVYYAVRPSGPSEPSGPEALATPCSGVLLEPGDDIQDAIDDNDEGTTFCLGAGSFEVPDNLEPKDGHRFIGAGMQDTFLEGTGAKVIVDAKSAGASDVLVQDMDISGARGASVACKPSCGSGFSGGEDNTISAVRLHDNPNHAIGGSEGGLLVEDSVLDHNGSDRFTGCCAGGIKGGNGFTIRRSEVFSNVGVGIWCDVGCTGGLEAYDNHVYDNTRDGIRYEISDGGALIENNVVENNNTEGVTGGHGGITSVGSSNALISDNVIRGNEVGGIVIVEGERGVSVTDVVVSRNELDGDAIMGCSIEGVSCD